RGPPGRSRPPFACPFCGGWCARPRGRAHRDAVRDGTDTPCARAPDTPCAVPATPSLPPAAPAHAHRTGPPPDARPGPERPAPRAARPAAAGPSAARSWRDQAGAEPVPARAHAGGLGEPGAGRRLADLAGLHIVRPPGLGSEQPDVAAVSERRERVRQGVEKVPVPVPPPQKDHVDHVVIVLVDKLGVLLAGDGFAQLLIAVVVVADLLHHLTRLDAKSLGQALLILRLARGRAH